MCTGINTCPVGGRRLPVRVSGSRCRPYAGCRAGYGTGHAAEHASHTENTPVSSPHGSRPFVCASWEGSAGGGMVQTAALSLREQVCRSASLAPCSVRSRARLTARTARLCDAASGQSLRAGPGHDDRARATAGSLSRLSITANH